MRVCTRQDRGGSSAGSRGTEWTRRRGRGGTLGSIIARGVCIHLRGSKLGDSLIGRPGTLRMTWAASVYTFREHNIPIHSLVPRVASPYLSPLPLLPSRSTTISPRLRHRRSTAVHLDALRRFALDSTLSNSPSLPNLIRSTPTPTRSPRLLQHVSSWRDWCARLNGLERRNLLPLVRRPGSRTSRQHLYVH